MISHSPNNVLVDNFTEQLKVCAYKQGADLSSTRTPLESQRHEASCTIVPFLSKCTTTKFVEKDDISSPEDAECLKSIFPKLHGQKFVEIVGVSTPKSVIKLNVGVVLSGGQAPGGHSVIAGVYDEIKALSAEGKLYGFLGGPHGIYSHKYIEITRQIIDKYRNTGGFHMIKSGRHKIETNDQKSSCIKVCQHLKLDGLVVIGGDDSNTNACMLAEYFKEHSCSTRVVGAPKTIDADLRNKFVEASFGFDTAVKIYAEQVGNLATEALTSRDTYYFLRIMGRSASHLALEVALQTRANLVLVGEEIEERKQSLHDIVASIVSLVLERSKVGKHYGLVLVPEGLIEFVPEISALISEINEILACDSFHVSRLSKHSAALFNSLPYAIQDQLLLDRDPHGNVQVAKIATEKLLLLMVQTELAKINVSIKSKTYYLGYEGRCGYPSVFDATYCYSIGRCAVCLIKEDLSGYMSVVSKLFGASNEYELSGCPLVVMMNIEQRKGKKVPVIKKFLISTSSAYFQQYAAVRQDYRLLDLYRSIGPNQLSGPLSFSSNFTIEPLTMHYTHPLKFPKLPQPTSYICKEDLKMISDLMESNEYITCKSYHVNRFSVLYNSELHNFRALNVAYNEYVNKVWTDAECRSVAVKYVREKLTKHIVPLHTQQRFTPLTHTFDTEIAFFNHNVGCEKKVLQEMLHLRKMNSSVDHFQKELLGSANVESVSALSVGNSAIRGKRMGIVLMDENVPGLSNALLALHSVCVRNKCTLYGFMGAAGLLHNEYVELDEHKLAGTANVGGFPILGRTREYEGLFCGTNGKKNLTKVVHQLKKLHVTCLVVCGGAVALADAALLSNYLITNNVITNNVMTNNVITNNVTTNNVMTNNVMTNNVMTNNVMTNNVMINNVTTNNVENNVKNNMENNIMTNNIMINNVKNNVDDIIVVALPASVYSDMNDLTTGASLGFDTASKVLSCLVGNLLMDSLSAAKYYYYVRVGCRDSCATLVETSLQTHCNVCVAGQIDGESKLEDVVQRVLHAVTRRFSDFTKNFGAVLVQDSLVYYVTDLKRLVDEVYVQVLEKGEQLYAETAKSILQNLSPGLSNESRKLLETLPTFFRQEIVGSSFAEIERRTRIGEAQEVMKYSGVFSCEQLLAELVGARLKISADYRGSYSAVCFAFDDQTIGAMPTQVDCNVGTCLGFAAGMLAMQGCHGYMACVKNVCESPDKYVLGGRNILSVCAYGREDAKGVLGSVGMKYWRREEKKSKHSVALDTFLSMRDKYVYDDLYAAPGPSQYFDDCKTFLSRVAFENGLLSIYSHINHHLGPKM